VLVADLFRRLRIVLVDEYPIVMATTRSAPGIAEGLPTGISNHRQATPMQKLMARPMTNFIRFLRANNIDGPILNLRMLRAASYAVPFFKTDATRLAAE
jgi:hypothetical protein